MGIAFLKLHFSYYFLLSSLEHHLGRIALLEYAQSPHVAHHVVDRGIAKLDYDVTFHQASSLGRLAFRYAIYAHPFAIEKVVRYYAHRYRKSRRITGVFGFGEGQLRLSIQPSNQTRNLANDLDEPIVIDFICIITRLVVVGMLTREKVQYRQVLKVKRSMIRWTNARFGRNQLEAIRIDGV